MTSSFSSNPQIPSALSSAPSFRPLEAKSPAAFRTISEVANDLSVPQHVLRFWESKFQQIRPLKRGGGRRYYRPEDIQLISGIKDLLYNQGFTIRGVQKLLKENGRSTNMRTLPSEASEPQTNATLPLMAPASTSQPAVRGLSPEKRRDVETVLSELKTLRDFLKQSGI